MIRILLGMCLRIKLTDKLDNESTKITASDMTNDVSSLEVTAKAEQIPRI